MEEVHANFNNGILSVTVPKNETHKKEILVSSSEDWQRNDVLRESTPSTNKKGREMQEVESYQLQSGPWRNNDS